MLIPGEALERWRLTILQRYAHETQALGRSVRLPGFLGSRRERIAKRLLSVLSRVARCVPVVDSVPLLRRTIDAITVKFER